LGALRSRLCSLHAAYRLFGDKSFTGTLAGILTDLGKIDPDDSVTKYIPEGRGTAYGTARVRHLLDMSVGIHFDEDYLAPDGEVSRYRRSAGWSVNEVGVLGTRTLLNPTGNPLGS